MAAVELIALTRAAAAVARAQLAKRGATATHQVAGVIRADVTAALAVFAAIVGRHRTKRLRGAETADAAQGATVHRPLAGIVGANAGGGEHAVFRLTSAGATLARGAARLVQRLAQPGRSEAHILATLRAALLRRGTSNAHSKTEGAVTPHQAIP